MFYAYVRVADAMIILCREAQLNELEVEVKDLKANKAQLQLERTELIAKVR